MFCKAQGAFIRRNMVCQPADDNFIFGENGRKFFKQVENTVREGEIARYKQFFLFLQCFEETCTPDT